MQLQIETLMMDFIINYRPQRKFAKVMFLHVSVCPQGGVSPWAGIPPWAGTHPQTGTPPTTVHAGIRSTSVRYASHWNAFLFNNLKHEKNPQNKMGLLLYIMNIGNYFSFNRKYPDNFHFIN